MDYSPDSCRNQFTPGQKDRMRAQAALYRGIYFPDLDLKKSSGYDAIRRLKLKDFESAASIGALFLGFKALKPLGRTIRARI